MVPELDVWAIVTVNNAFVPVRDWGSEFIFKAHASCGHAKFWEIKLRFHSVAIVKSLITVHCCLVKSHVDSEL